MVELRHPLPHRLGKEGRAEEFSIGRAELDQLLSCERCLGLGTRSDGRGGSHHCACSLHFTPAGIVEDVDRSSQLSTTREDMHSEPSDRRVSWVLNPSNWFGKRQVRIRGLRNLKRCELPTIWQEVS